jgi:hypothetical protein
VRLIGASRPQHAVGKAKREHGELMTVDRATVFPLTAMHEDAPTPPRVDANQLNLLG